MSNGLCLFKVNSLPFSLRWSAGVRSRFSGSYVCLSLTRPLTAGSMTMSLSFFSRFDARNSSFVKLQSVSEADCRVEAILLRMSSLADSGSSL